MRFKNYIIPALAFVCIIILLVYGRIPQNNSYHSFADERTFFGIPNFFNVVTNLSFAWVGILGMQLIKNIKESHLRKICTGIFIGFILVTFGSGYYHLYPNNRTLVFDRLPIVIIIESFFAFIIYDYINQRQGYRALFILNTIGIACTLYWMITELTGNGDVRWYAFAQFFPVLAISLIILLYKSNYHYNKIIIAVFIFFIIARLTEKFDKEIYQFFGQAISGHSLKHLFMSFAGYMIVILFQKRLKEEVILKN